MTAETLTPSIRPILGAIARQWRRIHPGDLNPDEALRLLGLLNEITDRLDVEQDAEPCSVVELKNGVSK